MTPPVRFSICVPNFNYARYLGRTLDSVLRQDFADLEVCLSDNASTDDSLAVAAALNDSRVRVHRNNWNVGFASNLDRAGVMAVGEHMIMLSSDDLMEPGALTVYDRVLRALGAAAATTVMASAVHVVDGEDRRTGSQDIDWKQWRGAERDEVLSAAAGADVWRMPAAALLRRSLELMRGPLPFLSTCYPRALFEAVEGYGGNRFINPDKWFSWKLLTVADQAVIIDAPLFAYRVHANNQGALQAKSGALKRLVDQYIATWDAPEVMLKRAGVSREVLTAAFIEHDVGLRGLTELARGKRDLARRMVDFGRACYPQVAGRNRKVWALRALLALGPLGVMVARQAEARVRSRWTAQESRQA